ncbi:MAG: cytochrome ubiquinol oxidase subunit I [Bacteroidales bacterium]|nr:cytochrome ubiquinol oxidase subunit I [Bacteroidales bacterium]
MTQLYDPTLVDWSRAQFALTAIYHWCFVPLTLGLSFIVAFMETLYVKTGNEEWKRITKFWMTLFGINFAIGVATGIILEFEFGTNWSNYSWFVGDIFGAPLAVEGIMAFFIESTFVAVMFFGWNKVSKKFHLVSTWLAAIGANLSALWILVANSWMQYPVGMHFNPDMTRNEMTNFWDVLFSPVAINKFLHTVSSGYVLSAVFVIGVSAWYMLKNREIRFAKLSILVAAVFGLITSLFIILTGDHSARLMAKHQPMKFAAMENIYQGQRKAPLVVFGVLKNNNTDSLAKEDFAFKLEIPNFLSSMAFLDANAYVPGIKDIVQGNSEHGIISASEKIQKGKIAIQTLRDYNTAKKTKDYDKAKESLSILNANYNYFGYGYLTDAKQIVPPVKLTFYSFRIMVALGFWFVVLFVLVLIFLFRNRLENKRWFFRAAIISIPLAYLASQLGWAVTEVGRQPWVIQDLMPAITAVSNINVGSVKITFALFAIIFTILLIAEIKIMLKQIKIGPKDGGNE